MHALIQFVCLFLVFNGIPGEEKCEAPVVSVFTVATENNHGLQRFLRSAQVYNINVEVLGLEEKWEGGDMKGYGGGQKVRLLKKRLEQLEPLHGRERIILFTDSYDVMFLGNLNKIVTTFRGMYVRVLFSAEPFCWPDPTLADEYPKSGQTKSYLNSGGFIGYYADLMEILNFDECKNTDDDQLYYTMVYLNEKYRTKYGIALDEFSVIFQTLNGVSSEITLVTNSTEDKFPYIKNAHNNKPLIIHGNGPSKLMLNHLSNYLAKAWSVTDGCLLCLEKRIQLKENSLPTILMGVFIEEATPFMEEFLEQIYTFDYPKKKIHLFIHNNIEFHDEQVEEFYFTRNKEYLSAKIITSFDSMSEGEARNLAQDKCINSACDYLFSIDSLSRVEPSIIRYLLATGYDVVAPMLVRHLQSWSNFWGAISNTGFYARSPDYLDIVNNKIKGIWNVPFITNCYMMNISLLRREEANEISYIKDGMDPDMAFCASLRNKGIMMHVSNEKELGHLINAENFDANRTNPDIYQVIDNNLEWEDRYLHTEYHFNLEDGTKYAMPCPDVYWFPIMSDRFCKEWIEIMEAYGMWSDGSNNDKRLEGGYEAVPTRDIHMKQVGLERQWLYILKQYVRPLQELVFTGYYHNPPVSLMNFVVRYRPDEQPSLRPHHDSSTYTINIALNTPHVDYEGGGCHFIRYNCSVRDTKRGWMLMHPGRLTHFHEGLRVTKGTRYIMISFVDP